MHFTAAYIDLNDSSLDGKNTFYATQMAVWQRGSPSELHEKDMKPPKTVHLQIPDCMGLILIGYDSVEICTSSERWYLGTTLRLIY